MKPFFIIFFFILISGIAYVFVRGVQSLASSPLLQHTYWIALGLLFLMMILTFAAPDTFSQPIAKTISFLGYSFLIILLYLFLSFLLIDSILLINKAAHFIQNIPQFRYWTTLISFGLIFVVMLIGNIRFNHPKTVRLNIETNNSKAGKKMKIVAVSDVHLGVSIDKKRLKQYVKMINSEKPDIVLIAGDLIDRSIKPVVENAMDETLHQIHAPLGVYGVLGNHEYYGEGKKAISDFYKKADITLLRDTSVLINNDLYIIGRDDATNRHRKQLKDLVANLEKSHPRILIDHQPRNLQKTVENNIDLQISGHTHRGQVFPGNLLVNKLFEVPYGYKQKGNTHIYVSSGLGIWGPQYRIGSQSELVVIDFCY